MKKGSFSHPRYEARGEAFREWHAGLNEDRGARARLRRAMNPGELMLGIELYQLLGKLQAAEPGFRIESPKVRLRLAALAGLAARVENDAQEASLPCQMGTAGGRRSSAGPAVSELRFRRLLTASSLDDRFLQLSRVIHLLGRTVNLLSLADAVLDWDDDPDLRQDWAYEYYQAALTPSRGDS